MIINDRETSYVIEAYDEGNNPLNLQKSMMEMYKGADLHRYVARQIVHALAGRDIEILSNVCRVLKSAGWQTLTGLDRITGHLMMHHGVHPLVLFWMATIAQEMAGLASDENGPFMSLDITKDYDDPECLTTVSFEGDICWYARRILILPARPLSVINAAESKPLGDFISHPILDQHPLKIKSFQHILENQDVILTIDEDGDREEMLLTISEAHQMKYEHSAIKTAVQRRNG